MLGAWTEEGRGGRLKEEGFKLKFRFVFVFPKNARGWPVDIQNRKAMGVPCRGLLVPELTRESSLRVFRGPDSSRKQMQF